jgi:hypothetical protein
MVTTSVGTPQRRICWPNPDCTCLEGGCGYCNEYRFRNVSSIERAVHRGEVQPHHRGTGDRVYDPMIAFRNGERNDWHNAESRIYGEEA